jgi:hypothetical protein
VKNFRHCVIAATALFINSMAFAQAHEPEPAESTPQDAAEASVLIRVIGPDPTTLPSFFNSTAVRRFAEQRIASGAESGGLQISIHTSQVLEAGEGRGRPVKLCRVYATLCATPAATRENAKRYLAGLVAALEAELAHGAERARERMAENLEHARRAEERAYERLGALRAQERELLAAADRVHLDRTVLIDEFTTAEQAQRELSLELEGLRARQQAIVEQTARVQHEVQERTARDPVAAELMRVVELREKELARYRDLQQAGMVPEAELDKAVEQLALARAELGRQQQALALAAGAEQLAGLNQQLAQLSIDLVEMEARRQVFARRLQPETRDRLLTLADELERTVGGELNRAANAVNDARVWRQAAEQELENYAPPTVTLEPDPLAPTAP